MINVKRDIILIAHDLRSCHNVGSLFRTAEGLGIKHLYLTGYSPHPRATNETRLPHLAAKLDRQIAKTSLGAEKYVPWSHVKNPVQLMAKLREQEYACAALEQAADAISLPDFRPPARLALIVGNEVSGLSKQVLGATDNVVHIPMFGRKESFNVVQAAAMALYHCRFAAWTD